MSIAGIFRKLLTRDSQKNPAKGSSINNSKDCTIVEPYSMGINSIEDGFYHSLFPSSSVHDSPPRSHREAMDKVRKTLSSSEEIARNVPRLPSVIPRLLRSLKDPEAAVIDFVKIINKDPTMSAAVLKLANSAYFNHSDKAITEMDTAVVKLGIEGLRSALSAAVMQPVIQRSSHYYTEFGQQLWLHCLRCAVACEYIATQRQLEPYKAYLLGLTHDIGKITVFSELCKEFKVNIGRDTPEQSSFAPLMKSDSARLSFDIAQQWELPPEITLALQQQINLKAGDKVGPYAQVLFQANLICEVLDAAQFHPPKAVDKLLRALDLPQELNGLLQDLPLEL